MAGFLGKIDQARGITQQQFTARRQMQTLPVAMKQRNANGGLKLFDARRDIGRNAVQFAGGLDDAAFVHDGFEDLQVGKIHCNSRAS